MKTTTLAISALIYSGVCCAQFTSRELKELVGFHYEEVAVTTQSLSLADGLSRSGPEEPALKIKYRTRNGTAVAGFDYTKKRGVLEIPANSGNVFPLAIDVAGLPGGSGFFFVELLPRRSKKTDWNNAVNDYRTLLVNVDGGDLPKVPEPYCPPYK